MALNGLRSAITAGFVRKCCVNLILENRSCGTCRKISIMGLLPLSNHVVQEQMTHWDMLNKENSNLVAFFNKTSGTGDKNESGLWQKLGILFRTL